MTDKTEEQIAADKAAVDAMRNAKANMTAALDRIVTLEGGLRSAIEALKRAKGNVPASAYSYNRERTLHQVMDADIAEAQKALG